MFSQYNELGNDGGKHEKTADAMGECRMPARMKMAIDRRNPRRKRAASRVRIIENE